MSHTTKLGTGKNGFRDLAAVAAAASQIPGLKFHHNQKTYQHYFGKKACDHAIGWADASRKSYEIGLVEAANEPGMFEMHYDKFDRSLEAVAGKDLEKLRMLCQVEAFRNQAAAQGHSCMVNQLDDGSYVVTADNVTANAF